jgi:ataxin-10
MPRIRPSPANPVSNEAPTERSLGGIKISLVRLLGVLSFEDTAVGDQVRERGGVELVLSMTEVDELNPCEHRINRGGHCPDQSRLARTRSVYHT